MINTLCDNIYALNFGYFLTINVRNLILSQRVEIKEIRKVYNNIQRNYKTYYI